MPVARQVNMPMFGHAVETAKSSHTWGDQSLSFGHLTCQSSRHLVLSELSLEIPSRRLTWYHTCHMNSHECSIGLLISKNNFASREDQMLY